MKKRVKNRLVTEELDVHLNQDKCALDIYRFYVFAALAGCIPEASLATIEMMLWCLVNSSRDLVRSNIINNIFQHQVKILEIMEKKHINADQEMKDPEMIKRVNEIIKARSEEAKRKEV